MVRLSVSCWFDVGGLLGCWVLVVVVFVFIGIGLWCCVVGVCVF